MPHHRSIFSLVAISLLAAGVARAAPLIAPVAAERAAERAAWTQRCWWVGGPWGPRRQCRPVWVEPYYGGYGPGWGAWGRGYGSFGRHWEGGHDHYGDHEGWERRGPGGWRGRDD